MNILEIVQLVTNNVWIYFGSFILILSLLVFVHEWGHYIVARLCGVRVEVFSIGFGKEIAGMNDSHGTRWKFSMIPLGGYVKLFGDVDPASVKHDDTVEDRFSGKERHMTDEELKVAFFNKPVWKRSLIVFAGPAINYIFAIIILSGLFAFNGKPVTPPVAAAISVESSADQYNFQPHDRVISIDNKPTRSFEDIRRAMMISLDQERHFVIERDGEMMDIYAIPEKREQEDHFGFKHSRGFLGLTSPRQAIDIKQIREIGNRSYKTEQTETVLKDLQRRMDTTFEIAIARGDDLDRLRIHPVERFNGDIANPEHKNNGILLLADIEQNTFVKYPPVTAVGKAFVEAWDVTVGTLEALGQMVTGTRSTKELGGIIRIGALAGDMAQQGLVSLILFTALLSINLGLINLFPVPLLDGGHLMFYAIESIIGRPIPEKIQDYAFQFGLVFLIALMAFTNLNDIVQLIL